MVGSRSDDVVVGVGIALHLDEAAGLGRLDELQEPAVAEALLAEVGLLLAHLRLEPGEVRRRLLRQPLDRRAQQREGGVLVAPGRRQGAPRDRPARSPGCTSTTLRSARLRRSSPKRAEAVVGLAERRLLAQDGALQHRRQHRSARCCARGRRASGDERVEVGLLGGRHRARPRPRLPSPAAWPRACGASVALRPGGAAARCLRAARRRGTRRTPAGSNADVDASTPMPITRRFSSRSLWTSGVKSLSPVPSTNVVM